MIKNTPSPEYPISAQHAKAWPFEEARKILTRLNGKIPEKGYVLFQTGYGPSGLPHIGTFGEVLRTTMIRHAFEQLSDIPTRLIAFSDDMDGLRKVPDNIPNQDMLKENLNKPLSDVPDPFDTYPSFAAHNNARLRQFLDQFGFDYQFKSATETYREGTFDQALLNLLSKYDQIMAIMLPTLGAERQATYSPFLPICPKTGHVLQVPVIATDTLKGTITYAHPDGQQVETPVTGGHCKLQWKADWAMRWYALQVDYEMSGKDLSESVKVSSKITRLLGGRAPENLTYELFLDEQGEKISKSKGNGLSMEEWLAYAPQESLAYFMYLKPKTAKKLYFGVIPKVMDEYLSHFAAFENLEPEKKLESPIWHIHNGKPPHSHHSPLSFSLLLNLASASNAEEKAVMWGFISRYAPEATPTTYPMLDQMADFAVRYFRDFIKPTKQYTQPDAKARVALMALRDHLQGQGENQTAEDLQNIVFRVGKDNQYENLRDWFKTLYTVLLGQDQGPRMGSFIALYGVAETTALIDAALNRAVED